MLLLSCAVYLLWGFSGFLGWNGDVERCCCRFFPLSLNCVGLMSTDILDTSPMPGNKADNMMSLL